MRLYDTFRHPIDLESFLAEVQLGIDDIHEVPDGRSFDDDVVSIFPEHPVDERRGGVDLEISQSVFLFEVEKLFVERIHFGEKRFLDLILIEDDAELTEWRISIRLPE